MTDRNGDPEAAQCADAAHVGTAKADCARVGDLPC